VLSKDNCLSKWDGETYQIAKRKITWYGEFEF